MAAFDGTFSEGASLNAVAWTGLRQPTILWTYNLAPDNAILDPYFQQHLLMNVYPMAPMPKNDHSINPGSEVVEAAYSVYAPLFDAMHGARWLLSARPVSVSDSTAVANVFILPSSSTSGNTLHSNAEVSATAEAGWPDLLVHVMLGDSSAASVTLNLEPAAAMYGWPAVAAASVATLHPGETAWSPPKNAILKGQSVSATIPLVRGCAAVKVSLRSHV